MPLPANLKRWTEQSLKQYNLWAGVKRGQHFLIDQGVLDSIVRAANIKLSDNILEVGGGLGILTLALIDLANQVVTVELEPVLVKALSRFLSTSPNLKVLAGDILKLNDEKILSQFKLSPGASIKIVANLPYDISGAFLKRFLSSPLPITDLTLLLQKEVAARLAARPGHMSLLSVLAQINSQVKIIRHVGPTSFYPPPQVDSAIVKITRYSSAEKEQLLNGVPEEDIWRWARIGYSARRKMLTNNLQAATKLSAADLSAIFKKNSLSDKARAQELSIEQWVELGRELSD